MKKLFFAAFAVIITVLGVTAIAFRSSDIDINDEQTQSRDNLNMDNLENNESTLDNETSKTDTDNSQALKQIEDPSNPLIVEQTKFESTPSPSVSSENSATQATSRSSSQPTTRQSQTQQTTTRSTAAQPSTVRPTTNNSSITTEEQVVKLVNDERAKVGLKALSINANLASAAFIRANETEILFSHTRPDGSGFSTALTQNGVRFSGAGENIAWGQSTPAAVMGAWMSSAGHRANILSSRFTEIGIGYYRNASGVIYWTQLFIH